MSLTVSCLSDTQADQSSWDEFVERCPEATFFHRSGWKDVTEKAFGHSVYFLKAERDGVLEGVLPLVHIKSRLFGNALISNAYCMGGAPAANTDEAHGALDARALELLKETGASYIEYRAPARTHTDWASRDDLYANFSRQMSSSEDEALTQIPRKQRAVVRKALKNQSLSFHLGDTVDDFYHLYATSVRNLGTPVFSKKYFALLSEIFGEECNVLTISHDNKPVSSVLSFYFRGIVMPYYTGSLPEARGLGSNDLMYWQLMRHGLERGCTHFDFGRSKVGTGPYAFKKNWGFEPAPITHEFYLKQGEALPNVNPTNPKYQLMVKAWQRLPLPIANLIGPQIVRYIG
jgi:FemAB-related protein (PEP-CTERM system-associated)